MFRKKIKTIINIEGMSCKHCANKVKTTLEKIENVKKVKVDLSTKEAIVTSNKKLNIKDLKDKIENLDYKITNIMEKNI